MKRLLLVLLAVILGPLSAEMFAQGPQGAATPVAGNTGTAAGNTTAGTTTAAGSAAGRPAQNGSTLEEGEDPHFYVGAYIGLSIDVFAAAEHQRYINPGSSDAHERGVAGFNFEKRLWAGAEGKRSFWVYGETVHGTRSSDVDCNANRELSICSTPEAEAKRLDLQQLGKSALYVFRNSATLEAFTGIRFDAIPLSEEKAVLYFKAQAGFITLAGVGGDVKDLHHVGVGFRSTSGSLRESYLEFGFGRSDLFDTNRRRRAKIDALLIATLGNDKPFRPFVQLTVDSDVGAGADSIQTYIGIEVDVKRALQKLMAPTP